MGQKFIPTLYHSIPDIFGKILIEFDIAISSFNSRLFIQKNKFSKKSNFSTKTSTLDNNCSTMKSNIFDNLLSKKSNLSNLWLSNEATEIRYQFYNKLSNSKINLDNNIELSQVYAIKYFQNKRPFAIIQCDKNVGLTILSHETHNALCFEHLADTNTYKKLTTNPLNATITKINNILDSLVINNFIDKRLSKKLIANGSCKLGKFRILAKLHKSNFGVRPIINCTGHPTQRLCILVDNILKPMVKQMDSYLQDSQQLLQDCQNFNSKQNKLHLYSCDFESLYTNIRKVDALNLICDYVKNKLVSDLLTINAFYAILEIIFEENIFVFNEIKSNNHYKLHQRLHFYRQVTGVAMGCVCGPSIANIFVYVLEKKWLNINNSIILIYRRYIDDIFMVLTKKLDKLNFQSHFNNLKINIDENEFINFLDLIIWYDYLTGNLNFSLYVKPTNTHGYVQTISDHPNHIFKNNPKSLMIRIRRICSVYSDYLYFTRNLIFQLAIQGYKIHELIAISNTIGNISRSNLIPYKDKINNFEVNNSLLFVTPYHKQVIKLNTIILDSYLSIKSKYSYLNNVNFKVVNSVAPNILSIFVHNFKLNFFNNTTTTCKTIRCSSCNLIFNGSFFTLGNSFYVPLASKCNCTSTGNIYIILCTLCNDFYIGETGNTIKKRISSHLTSIKQFKPFLKYTSEVGEHFNLRYHNYLKHFRFAIFKNDINSKNDRLEIENNLINLFIKFHGKVINSKLPINSTIKGLKTFK
jgi:hypothetical protein